MDTPTNKVALIKTIYFYLVSFVGLMMVVISTGNLINIVIKMAFFPNADMYSYYSGPVMEKPAVAVTASNTSSTVTQVRTEEQLRAQQKEEVRNQRQRDVANDISFIVVGLPLYIFHWRLARRKAE